MNLFKYVKIPKVIKGVIDDIVWWLYKLCFRYIIKYRANNYITYIKVSHREVVNSIGVNYTAELAERRLMEKFIKELKPYIKITKDVAPTLSANDEIVTVTGRLYIITKNK